MVVNNIEKAIEIYGPIIKKCPQFKEIKILNKDNIVKAFESCVGSTWLTEIALKMFELGLLDNKEI